MIGATVISTMRDRVKDAHEYIEKHRQRRQSNKVLHAHPSPLFWSERNVPIKEVMIRRKFASPHVSKRINL